jgi:hypothetical protein
MSPLLSLDVLPADAGPLRVGLAHALAVPTGD